MLIVQYLYLWHHITLKCNLVTYIHIWNSLYRFKIFYMTYFIIMHKYNENLLSLHILLLLFFFTALDTLVLDFRRGIFVYCLLGNFLFNIKFSLLCLHLQTWRNLGTTKYIIPKLFSCSYVYICVYVNICKWVWCQQPQMSLLGIASTSFESEPVIGLELSDHHSTICWKN